MHPSVEYSVHTFFRSFTRPFVHRSFVHRAVRPFVRSSVRPSIQPSVRPSIRLSVRPSVRSSVHPSVDPSFRPSVHPYVHSSVRPSIRPSIRPSVRFQIPICLICICEIIISFECCYIETVHYLQKQLTTKLYEADRSMISSDKQLCDVSLIVGHCLGLNNLLSRLLPHQVVL